MNIKLS